MQWFKNQKTVTKLMLGFGLMAALMGFVGYEGICGMRETNDLLEDLYKKHTLGVAHLKEANVDLVNISRAVRNAILDDEADDVQKRISDIPPFPDREGGEEKAAGRERSPFPFREGG